MRDDELKGRFGELRQADARGRVPGFGVMRARALEGTIEGTGFPRWWLPAAGGVLAAAAVLVFAGGERTDGLEGLPPLLGDSVEEVEFLEAAAGGERWLGVTGSDVLLPAEEIEVL